MSLWYLIDCVFQKCPQWYISCLLLCDLVSLLLPHKKLEIFIHVLESEKALCLFWSIEQTEVLPGSFCFLPLGSSILRDYGFPENPILWGDLGEALEYKMLWRKSKRKRTKKRLRRTKMPDIHTCWEIILVFSVRLSKGFMNKDSWGFEEEDSNPQERDLQRDLDICFPRFISLTLHMVMNLETVSSSH